MKHLGDITKINGAEIEPVHCIIGGKKSKTFWGCFMKGVT